MNKLFFQYRNKIFFRNLLVNFGIILSLVLIYQFVVVGYFSHYYKQRTQSTFLNNAMNTQHILDTAILSRAAEIVDVYFSNADITGSRLGTLGRGDLPSVENVLRTSETLDSIVGSTPSIYSMSVYLPRSDVLFLNGNIKYLKEYPNGTAMIPSSIRRGLGEGSKDSWSFDEATGLLSYVRCLPYFSPDDRVDSVVSVDFMVTTLRAAAGPGQSLSLFTLNGDPVFPTDWMAQEQLETVRERIALGETGRVFTLSGRERYAAVLLRSEVANLCYAFGMEDSFVTPSFILSIGLLLLLNFGLMGVYALIAYSVNKRVHSPLQRILNRAQAAGGGETGLPANDYQLLDNTVSEVDLLQEQLETHSGLVYATIIRSLLDGNFDDEVFLQNYKTCGIHFSRAWTVSVILRLRPNRSSTQADLIESTERLVQLLSIPGDAPSAYTLYPVFDAESCSIHAVVNADEADERAAALAVRSLVAELSPDPFVLFVGRCYELHETHIYRSMTDARALLDYAWILPAQDALLYSEIAPESLNRMGEHHRVVKRVEELVGNKSLQLAQSEALGLLDSLRGPRFEITYIKKVASDLVVSIKIGVSGVSSAPCPQVAALGPQSICGDIDQFQAYLTGVVFPAIERMFRSAQGEMTLERRMLRMIDEYLYENVSLEFIADKLGMKSSAFSKAFKAMTSITFIEYVKNLKLERAAGLLKERQMTIKQLSLKLGYTTPHYFIKIFKERYGCTPKQYQTNFVLRNEEDGEAGSGGDTG